MHTFLFWRGAISIFHRDTNFQYDLKKKIISIKPKLSGLASCGKDISLHIKGNIEITKLVENFVCNDPTVSGLEGCFGVFSNFPFNVKY